MTSIKIIKGKSSTSEIIEALKDAFYAFIDKGNKKFKNLNETPKAIYTKEDAFRLIGEIHSHEFQRFAIEMTTECQNFEPHESIGIKIELIDAKHKIIHIEGFVKEAEISTEGLYEYERLLQRNRIAYIALAKVAWYEHLWKIIQKAAKIDSKSPIVKIIK